MMSKNIQIRSLPKDFSSECAKAKLSTNVTRASKTNCSTMGFSSLQTEAHTEHFGTLQVSPQEISVNTVWQNNPITIIINNNKSTYYSEKVGVLKKKR